MFNNKYNNGAFWGAVIGTSLGIIVSSQVSPLNRRKMMRTARKARNSFKSGMNNLWS